MIRPLLIAILLLSISTTFATEQKVVRLGYYQSRMFQEGGNGTPLRGYAYDYYQQIAQNTGWRYEYVYGEFNDLYKKLVNGEIDMLAGVSRLPERNSLMGFVKFPMGFSAYVILKKADGKPLSTDNSTLQGKTIGTLEGSMEGLLRGFLAQHKIHATVKTYQTMDERDAALEQDSVYAVFTERTGSRLREGYMPAALLGSSAGGSGENDVINAPYFLAVSQKRPDLLAATNIAIEHIIAIDPIYLARLYDKYVSADVVSKILTPPERAWISKHDTLKIAFLNNMLPYSNNASGFNIEIPSYVSENSDIPEGLLEETIPEILRQLNLSKTIVKYQSFDNYEDMVSSVTHGENDLAFPVGGSLYHAEQGGFYESRPVIKSELDLIYAGQFNESLFKNFAVNKKNGMMKYYIQDHFPNAKIQYYDSIEECLKAVQRGEVKSTIISSLRSVHILKNREFLNLSFKSLNIANDKFFGVAVGNEPLLGILNRGLTHINKDYTTNLAYKYAEKLHKASLLDVVSERAGTAAAFFAFITLIFAFLIIRLRSRAAKERTQNDKLATQIGIIQTVSNLYHSVFLVDLRTHSFQVLHTLDSIEKAIAPFKNNAQDALDLFSNNMVLEKYKPAMIKFNNLEHWKKVFLTKDSIYEEYEGKVMGWCGVTVVVARRNNEGKPTHVVYISQEINRQKKTEQNLKDALLQAEQANKAKTFFLNNMSHDIRTPMNAIIGFTALAAAHKDNKNRLQDYLDKINTSSEHLLSLINDVLDMRRIESGKVKLDEKEMHLPELLHDIKTIVQTNVLRKQQELFIDAMDITNEDVIADKLRLNQVLLNLLSNATKFTKNGGTISLRVLEKPCNTPGFARFEFRVKDNGIGISKEFLNHIFEAFSREETSTVSGIQGTGLGMAITKNIVTMMGGTIEIESEEGKGTEFIVSLEFKICDSSSKYDFIPKLQGLRALVADDDSNTCLSVSKMLREIGMKPEWTTSGKEAVLRVQDAKERGAEFSAYIIDWFMPDMNGIETVRRIRRVVGNDNPIIILTAYDWSDIEEEALEAGVTAFCSKPLFMSELRAVLANPFSAVEKPKEKEAFNFNGIHILLVEDNMLNQEIAKTILEEAGFNVDVANNGKEAVEKIEAANASFYKIVLMDIQMPIMDGYEATRTIRNLSDKAKASVPIVAMTANAFDEDKKHALDVGMNGHLAKPIDIKQLLGTLKDILNKG